MQILTLCSWREKPFLTKHFKEDKQGIFKKVQLTASSNNSVMASLLLGSPYRKTISSVLQSTESLYLKPSFQYDC